MSQFIVLVNSMGIITKTCTPEHVCIGYPLQYECNECKSAKYAVHTKTTTVVAQFQYAKFETMYGVHISSIEASPYSL